jgi:hypothetical protein
MEKEIPFRHSKLPVKAKWITTDEIIAEQKIEAKVHWPSILRETGSYSRIDEIHLQ